MTETGDGFGPRASTPGKKGSKKKKAKGGGEVSPQPEERVNVIVRIRPQLYKTEGGEDNMSLQVDSARNMVWALAPDDDGSGRGKLPRQFVFDTVVPPDGVQEDVYEAAGRHIVESVLEGFTGCVMCYGQTGAGKTYTLANESAGHNAGVMIRAFTDIFDHIAQDREHEYEVTMAYAQVYLDTLSDLLSPDNDVQIREDTNKGVFLTGLTWRPCRSVAHAKGVLADGNRNRATASTSMNADSSRSHAILMMHVTRTGGTRTLLGKLYLVDLAGSERVKRSGVEGQGLDEAIAINQSLTTLGRCIEAMARGKKGERPPFRESKLTRLLSNAIGGNAKTTLIVCVAPSKRDVVETNSSLEFGQQAMNVVVRAKVNATVDYAGLSSSLQEQLDAKQSALRRLEHKLLTKLAPAHEAALKKEAEAKQVAFEARDAAAERLRARAQIEELVRARADARKDLEVEMAAAHAQRQDATSELARVIAALKDTAELRRLRAQQEAETLSLTKQLDDARRELARAEAALKARGGGGGGGGANGGVGGQTVSGAAGPGGGGEAAEKELLVGVAKNLGNLALHFVRAEQRTQAEPLIISAQSIFEAVLGAGHAQIGEWQETMRRKISAQNDAAAEAHARARAQNGHARAESTVDDDPPGAGGFPVVELLEAFALPPGSASISNAVGQITELLGSFSNPRAPARGAALRIDLSRVNGRASADPAADDARRAARKHVLAVLSEPLRKGDRTAEGRALTAVRDFFVEHGNGEESIVLFHRLVFSAKSGARGALDEAQAYGNNYNPEFVRSLQTSFRAQSSSRSTVVDGLTTARDDENAAGTGEWTSDDAAPLSKEGARAQLLQVAGTPRGGHLSASTPRNEGAAEAALRNFMLAHGDGDEALTALQQLIKDDLEKPSDRANGVRRIVAGEDANDIVARRRLEATAKLLEVAGTPRGNHLSAQTPRDVRSAEAALQGFIEAHGGGAEGLDALQQLMAASVSTKAQPAPPPKPAPAVRPPRDPPATYSPPPARSTGGSLRQGAGGESKGNADRDRPSRQSSAGSEKFSGSNGDGGGAERAERMQAKANGSGAADKKISPPASRAGGSQPRSGSAARSSSPARPGVRNKRQMN